MIYKLSQEDKEKLISLPETGMGYQVIRAQKEFKSVSDLFVVLNAQIIIDADSQRNAYEKLVLKEGFKSILRQIEPIGILTKTIEVLPGIYFVEDALQLNEYKSMRKKRHAQGESALDNAEEDADGKEIFVRLSAYEDDVRIDFSNMKLKPNSYATTEVDYKACVATSDDPLDRYAIPNDEQIEWAFYIRPVKNDSFQRGIVQPKYGHDGGGVEAYFENGTSNDTYYKKSSYGS